MTWFQRVGCICLSAFLAAPVFSGDGNCDGDCDVDLTDFASFQLCFTGPGIAVGFECLCSDLDDDGDVDLTDFNEFQLAFTGPEGSVGATTLELAGNPLGEFPHFEYVRAFNEGDLISLAVDPTLVPGINGLTCDLYVVEAQTAGEWEADGTLTDVRAGGAQAISFSGATVQANTFVINESDMLSSEAGLDLGHGYDLVLDCDQDGILGCVDFIDGFGDEAGMYVMHDLTLLGPLTASAGSESITLTPGPGNTIQHRVWYPDDIASVGPLPLVVIGHGGGHQFSWYDFIQEHLASYGYVSTSHQNTFPFPPTLNRVLFVTDAFLGQLDTIQGGVLDGLVDSTRVSWIGHSLGGRAVVLAYDDLVEGSYVPTNYDLSSVKLISAIAANALDGPLEADRHEANFHMLFGSADGDISGGPSCDQLQPLRHYDRARGFRQSTYVHGADHNDFNCCGFEDFQGPAGTAIGRPEAQQVMKSVYVALHKVYVEGNIPARDYLWRQWESFHPIGVADTTTVVNMYSEGEDSGKRVIDDFQTNPAPDQSSSGGSVFFDVSNLVENRLDDTNSSFTWDPSDPMNGMTYGGAADSTRGVVFDYTVGQEPLIAYGILPGDRDFSPFKYLSFRACQGTRHPETIAELGDLTFTVTLVDGSDVESSINIGAYGGGIEEPYQRTGAGIGAGWQNEFETIRIRLTDFLANGTGLDLGDIEEIRLDFGASFGSSRGRIGFDDLELTVD